jgi:uncharacterized protein with HEPN domain
MSKSQQLYLQDILEQLERIDIIASEGKETFFNSRLYQDAAIRNFEVIGEVVKRLSPELKALQPDIPWRDYAGFRDTLIHQYDKVLVEIVWESIQNDTSPLRQAVEALLADLPDDK